MARDSSSVTHAVPDASFVAKWHNPAEVGSDHARRFLDAFAAGRLELTAPDQLKTELARVLQLGVRDKRYPLSDGIDRLRGFLALGITFIPNDAVYEDAFRLATHYYVAFYDALYLAVAEQLDLPFITADRRFFTLAQQRRIARVLWFEDATPGR